jgi:DNA polymerase-3 subunit delta'
LLTGARGLGKGTFAKVLTCALFCTSESKPCGVCEGCKGVLRDANPDVLRLVPEGEKQIGIEKVREVIDAISQHAFGAGYRVVLIEPVEKLTPQAQNCLLKSLEEPASNVVFLLMAHELTAVLGTIASRCLRVAMTPWPDERIRTTLGKLGVGSASVERVLPLAGGNIGQALDLLEDQQQDRELQAWVHKALSASGDGELVPISTSLKEDREGAQRLLNALEQALRLALLVKTGQLGREALQGYPRSWQEAVEAAPTQGLTGLMRSVAQARRLRASQVNWQSTLDHLMMKLLRERMKWRQLSA